MGVVDALECRALLSGGSGAAASARGAEGPGDERARDVGAIAPGGSLQLRDRVGAGDRRDEFGLWIDGPAIVTARVSGLKSGARLELADASGRVRATSDRPGRADEAIALAMDPGRYFVRVIGRGRGSTRYVLTLGAESIPMPPSPPIPTPPAPPPSRLVERGDGVVYVPSGLEAGRAYPLLVAYDPGGDGRGSVDRLVAVAERQKWVVYGSSYYRNDHPDVRGELDGPAFAIARGHLDALLREFPVDASRVVLSGFSGGGSFAHAMNFKYPGLASALIVNTAMIWGFEVPDTGVRNGADWYGYGEDNAPALASAYARTSRRLAVFLASPGDFRYEEMRRDADLLAGRLGWSTRWIEFVGGHAVAPEASYRAAIDWLTGQPSWR